MFYTPDEKCIELKSFKEYITAYRNVGIFHEFLANKILDDLVSAVDPRDMNVRVEMNPRGNIKTVVESDYYPGNHDSKTHIHETVELKTGDGESQEVKV